MGVFYSALRTDVLIAMGASVVIAIPIFIFCGLYRAVYRYAGFAATVAIVRAMLMYTLIYAAIFLVLGVKGVPRTIGLIQPALLLVGVGASRMFARFWLSGEYLMQLGNANLPRVIIYGAGEAGRQLAVVIGEAHQMVVAGFVDDDPKKHGLFISGLRVYPPEKLQLIARKFGIKEALLAIPSAPSVRRKEIIAKLTDLHLNVRTIPAMAEIATGQVKVSSLKQVSIEDLLGRDPVEPIPELIQKTITGKTVMVTGAGGSIGSELCRQIVQQKPKVLLLVERTEFALYSIHLELTEKFAAAKDVKIYPLLADVKDAARMREIMTTWKVQTVYHAAAYKHVPMVERNPMEGIENNVFGTLTVALAARECGVERFTLISTDKAVRPTNVMGASKRLCELILQAMAAGMNGGTIYTMVRFGNVLGSSGSVVPRFRKQIVDGGPVTVTHSEITRYFMTIPEASQLVIQAGSMGTGGDVFLLDMGEPVKILELAKRMVRLSGLTVRDEKHPNGDIEVKVTGLRPGEKLYEELLVAGDPSPTQHPRIFYAKEVAKPREDLLEVLKQLRTMLDARDRKGLRETILQCVPEYQPKDGIMDWVVLESEAEGEI